MIEIYNDKDLNYRFCLKAKSGHILLNSIGFTDRIQMNEAMNKLSAIAITRNHFERKTNHAGQFLFNLKDNNGNLIGRSQLYDSEMGMENGIKNLQNRIEALRNGDGLKFVQNS